MLVLLAANAMASLKGTAWCIIMLLQSVAKTEMFLLNGVIVYCTASGKSVEPSIIRVCREQGADC